MINHEFQELINRYFKGQLADNEYVLLTKFLQGPENREYFDQAKLEWDQNPELDQLSKRNLNRLQFTINKLQAADRKKAITRKRWIQVVSVAAILVIGLLSGSILTHLFSGNNDNREQLVFETPRGEKSMVYLPDGSQVWLNANSRLVYHSFSSTHRQVELKGEAFFQVTHNKNAPFVVKTNECSVEVLGTTFNVMAYDEFGRKEITLIEGKVNVHTDGNQQVLKPGQAYILKDHKIQVLEVNPSQASGWVENKFNFQNIPLSELMKRLENWYDVDITLDNQTGRDVNYTGTFKNEETIWQVLDALKVYIPIHYKKTESRKIVIVQSGAM